jgi:hypothetical protein
MNNEYGYYTKSLGRTYIQAYADDIVLVDETARGLQKQINPCENFFKFANIKLNPGKCEVFKVSHDKEIQPNIVISQVEKSYLPNAEFINYLGVPLGSKRSGAFKYGSKIIQTMLEYLHKVKTSRLAPNQKIHAIKTFIIPKLHYASANNVIKITDLKFIDHEIRKEINDITKSQPLPLHYIYASYKDGGLGLAKCEDEYHTYKIHHVAHLMKTEHGRSY